MDIAPVKFGLAVALATAILWIICSALVFIWPDMMMFMSGHMVHMDIASLGWHLTLGGVLLGLLGWSLSAGIFGWLLACIYNSLR